MDEDERSTPTKRILLAAVTFLLLSGPLSAHANIIYTWTGTCQGLECTGQAHMEIVLPDTFVPGTTLLPVPGPPPLSLPRFPALSFIYSDNNHTLDLLTFPPDPGSFVLLPITSGPGSLSDISDLLLHLTSPCNEATRFCTGGTAAGTWGLLEFGPGFFRAAAGSGGLWQRIPEPSTFVLLGVGLAGLVFYRRRWVG